MQLAAFPTASHSPFISSGVLSGVPSRRTAEPNGLLTDLGNFLTVLRGEAGILPPDAALNNRKDLIQPLCPGNSGCQAQKRASPNAVSQSFVSSGASGESSTHPLGARRDNSQDHSAQANSARGELSQQDKTPADTSEIALSPPVLPPPLPQGDPELISPAVSAPGLVAPGLVAPEMCDQSQTLCGSGGNLIPASERNLIADTSRSAIITSHPLVQQRPNSKENSPKLNVKTDSVWPVTPLASRSPAESIPLLFSFGLGLSVISPSAIGPSAIIPSVISLPANSLAANSLVANSLAANSLVEKTPPAVAEHQQSQELLPSNVPAGSPPAGAVQPTPLLSGDGRLSSQAPPPAEKRSAVELESSPLGKLAFKAILTPLDGFAASDAHSHTNADLNAGGMIPKPGTLAAGLSVRLVAVDPYERPADVPEPQSKLQSTDASNQGMNSEEIAVQPPAPGNSGDGAPRNPAENQQAEPGLRTDANRPPVTAESINPPAEKAAPGQVAPGQIAPEQVANIPIIATPSGSISPVKPQPSENNPATAKLESKTETSLPNQPQAAREISVKLSRPEMPNVDIRLSDRGGRILVSVRSESPELAASLRSDLGELVGRLEGRGYQAETAVPSERIEASHFVGLNQPGNAGQSQSGPGQSGPDHSGPDEHTPGNSSHQQNQQEPRRRPQPLLDHSPSFSLDEVQLQ